MVLGQPAEKVAILHTKISQLQPSLYALFQLRLFQWAFSRLITGKFGNSDIFFNIIFVQCATGVKFDLQKIAPRNCKYNSTMTLLISSTLHRH